LTLDELVAAGQAQAPTRSLNDALAELGPVRSGTSRAGTEAVQDQREHRG
jgi:hypothetical protein